MLKAMEASGETLLIPDMYTALERKMVDGVLIGPRVLLGYRLNEVINYRTVTHAGSGLAMVVMNLNTWNSLPPDTQKIVDELSLSALQKFYTVQDVDVQDAYASCEAKGIESFELSPEEVQRWGEAVESFAAEWVAEVDAKGLPGTEMVNEIRQVLAK